MINKLQINLSFKGIIKGKSGWKLSMYKEKEVFSILYITLINSTKILKIQIFLPSCYPFQIKNSTIILLLSFY